MAEFILAEAASDSWLEFAEYALVLAFCAFVLWLFIGRR